MIIIMEFIMKTVTKISKFPKKFTIPAADFKRTLHS